MEKIRINPLPDDPEATATDRKFIERTYEIARNAVAQGNHPFGALLVRNGEVIMEVENAVTTMRDMTKHAETRLIGEATQKFDLQTLAECALYTSTEPCVMCSGAIYWAGLKKIVFGASADQMMKIFSSDEYNGFPVKEIYARMAPQVEVVGPVEEKEGLEIHAGFWPTFSQSEEATK